MRITPIPEKIPKVFPVACHTSFPTNKSFISDTSVRWVSHNPFNLLPDFKRSSDTKIFLFSQCSTCDIGGYIHFTGTLTSWLKTV